MIEPILEVKDLQVSYGRDVVLTGTSLAIKTGECLAVVGPNGCGKTTLLRTISGYIHPFKGIVRFRGQNITDKAPWCRSRLGLVHVLEGGRVFPSLSVEENILTVWQPRQLTKSATLEAAFGLAPQLASDKLRKRPAATLSGGERQLLVLVRAAIMNPRVVLLDSPFLGVGSNMRETVLQCIKGWTKNAGIAVILVEHDKQAIEELSTRLYPMSPGSGH